VIVLFSDLIRAARLDGSLYAQVKADTTATARALLVVGLVALAHGVGGIIRAIAFGRDPPGESFLIGVQGELVFWAVATSAVYLLGSYVFGTTATYGQVLRPFSFAGVPGLLILVAALASLLGGGAQMLAFAVLVPWRLAASYVAVRQALGLGRTKSAFVLLGGVACGLVSVGAGTAAVLSVLA
jgi:hypothetical protein